MSVTEYYKFLVRLKMDLGKRLQKYCEEHGHTLIWFISRAIEEKLAREKKRRR